MRSRPSRGPAGRCCRGARRPGLAKPPPYGRTRRRRRSPARRPGRGRSSRPSGRRRCRSGRRRRSIASSTKRRHLGQAGVVVELAAVAARPSRGARRAGWVGTSRAGSVVVGDPVGVEPGVQFQAAAVRLADGDAQRVPAGVPALVAGQALRPRLVRRGPQRVGGRPHLEDHGVQAALDGRVEVGRAVRAAARRRSVPAREGQSMLATVASHMPRISRRRRAGRRRGRRRPGGRRRPSPGWRGGRQRGSGSRGREESSGDASAMCVPPAASGAVGTGPSEPDRCRTLGNRRAGA